MAQPDPGDSPRAPAAGRAARAVFFDAGRRRTATDLVVHVSDGVGPMFLVGESGSGKTTLLRWVAEEAAAQDIPVIQAGHASGPSSAFLALITALESAEPGNASATGLPMVGRRAGIVVDDAENCPVAVWHKLAGLSRAGWKLPAMPPMILAMAPEFLPWLQQLALVEAGTADARVRHLAPFTANDVSRYLSQHLKTIGYGRPDAFSPEAIGRITEATGGMPGPINRLCDQLLAIAPVRGGDWISLEMIEAALAGAPVNASSPRPQPRLAVAVPPDPTPRPSPRPTIATPRITPSALRVDEPDAGVILRHPAEMANDEPILPRPQTRARRSRPSAPPAYGYYWQEGTLFRSRRRPRRWVRVLIACGIAAVVAVAAVVVLQARRSSENVAKTPSPGVVSLEPEKSSGVAVPNIERISPSPLAPRANEAPVAETAPPVSAPAVQQPDTTPPPTTSTPAPKSDATAPSKSKAVASEKPRSSTKPPPSPVVKPVPAPGRPASDKGAANEEPSPPSTSPPIASSAKAPAASSAPPATAETAETAEQVDDTEEAPAPPRPIKEIIAMGDSFRASGDVAWARKFYWAAQERGSAKAAAALGETYDPRYVDKNDRPDPQVARELYEQAARQGDHDAAKQLDDLDSWLNGEQ